MPSTSAKSAVLDHPVHVLGTPPHVTSDAFNGHAVRHGFFGRRGGTSVLYFESLNAGFANGDNNLSVQDNRALIAKALEVHPDHLHSLKQVHGNECVFASEEPFSHPLDRMEGDALATDVPGLGIGVVTADCAPVLFSYDGARPVVGAAHAGWQGALRGVLESTIAKMEELGATRDRITAAIGPCIAQKSYEVSEIFAAPFLEKDGASERFFMAGKREGKLMFDLAGYCAHRLAMAGIGRIDIIGHDTYAMEDDYFSHRRSTHQGQPMRGLQLSAIAIAKLGGITP